MNTHVDDYLKMLKYFPLMIPDDKCKYWEGVLITKAGKEIMIAISTPYYPSIKDIRVQPAILQAMLEESFKQKKIKNMSLTEVLLCLQVYEAPSSFNEDLSNLKELKKNTISMVERYSKILSELKCLDSWKISGVDENLTRFSLSVVDSSGYKHRMDLKVPENYPQSPPIVEFLDLPETVIGRITNCDSIAEMYTGFVCVVGELEVFWRIYDEIRGSCWVIDPAHSVKKDTYCRIVIDKNISIIVTLNPLFPNACPDVRFLGPEKDVLPLRSSMERNLKVHGWDEGKFFVDNLTFLMEIDELPLAPSQNTANQSDVSSQLLVDNEECMICFELRSEDDLLPAKICNNEKCASLFHVSCLIQWLQSVPTNEPSFNLISGECPHCGECIYRKIRNSIVFGTNSPFIQDETGTRVIEKELLSYLGEPSQMDPKNGEQIFSYWSLSAHQNLKSIAFKYLSIPTCTVFSERLAGNISGAKRNRLDPEKVKMLEFLNKNLK